MNWLSYDVGPWFEGKFRRHVDAFLDFDELIDKKTEFLVLPMELLANAALLVMILALLAKVLP